MSQSATFSISNILNYSILVNGSSYCFWPGSSYSKIRRSSHHLVENCPVLVLASCMKPVRAVYQHFSDKVSSETQDQHGRTGFSLPSAGLKLAGGNISAVSNVTRPTTRKHDHLPADPLPDFNCLTGSDRQIANQWRRSITVT